MRYFNKQGVSWKLNYGYKKSIHGGGDGIHQGPYLKASVNTKSGAVIIHIPLK